MLIEYSKASTSEAGNKWYMSAGAADDSATWLCVCGFRRFPSQNQQVSNNIDSVGYPPAYQRGTP